MTMGTIWAPNAADRGTKWGQSTAGPPVLVSIAVTFVDDGSGTTSGTTFKPTVGTQRSLAKATGTYTIGPTQDITATVTWTSGTPGTCTISNAGGTEGNITAVSANNGTTSAATTSLITATQGAISGNATISVDTARDATSNIRCPVNAYQWATLLGYTAPDNLYLCQEASGNLADSIGAITLTATNTPVYNQAVTGWTRTAAGITGGTAQRFANTTAGDTATNSMLLLMFTGFTAAPTASSYIASVGSSDDCSCTAGSAGQQTFRYREGANISQATGTYTNPTIYPVTMKHDLTNSAARLYTDTEKLSPTYGVTAGTNLSLGALAGTSSKNNYVYVVRWIGANAELSDANIKARLVALGWTITWS